MKKIYTIICILALCGCSGFLEEYSQDKAYVKSYNDLDEILLGNAYFERFRVEYGWQFTGITGETYWPYVHVMADELVQQTGGGDSWVEEWACGTIFGYHTWQYRVYENMEGKTAWDDAADFRHLYSHINACNIVLEEVKAFENGTEEVQQNIDRIKGESYFLRGSCYFFLANLYGKPYSAATAAEDPAIPIKLSNNVEDKYYQRNSVAEVYEQVISDLLEAEKYLKDVPKKSVWRADVIAARLMLSRVYLFMSDYEKATEYAQMVIEQGPALTDLNGFSGSEFLNPDLSELIFSTGASSLPGSLSFYSSGEGSISTYVTNQNMRISDDLYMAYKPREAKDLRLEHFVVSSEELGILYKKMHGPTFTTLEMSDIFVLRTSEAYLNLAEAAACAGDETTAQKALNDLREKRIKREVFDEAEVNGLSRENLVHFIREERRRELCLEGHRWFDLRRYKVAEKYPQETTIEHVVMNKVYNNASGRYETVWNRKFTLTPDDPAWVLPLPKVELDKNTGMIDNPRNERIGVDVE
ncbi:MAG TPA: RagB/SusD family nutrient uptake outer membrane protein [Candidatus Butyricimonas faecavium]|nr:RagB/SusD family nutrient uptake outer membrane protein [Candidatus Butyricimonas faecavium]